MLRNPRLPGTVLVELSDLAGTPPAEIAADREPLAAVVRWAEEYLCRPHVALGRSGPVCPFVQASMKRRHFYLAAVRGATLTAEEVRERIVAFRDWFLELPPRQGEDDAGLKTVLVVFPDLPRERVPELIDATQEELKPLYVPEGLMVGEFHDGPPDKAGLWNPDFRPLASPLPMLVIRHMVPTDFAFLRGEKRFVAAYLAVFGERIPAHLRDEVRAEAARFGLHVAAPEELEGVHPRVAAALVRHGVRAVVHRHRDMPQPQRGPEDVARALGWPLDRITKSLFLRAAGGRYAIVVCPVDRRVDLGRVAAHLGSGRLELAGQQELSAWLGFSPGGVSPIGAGEVAVVLDDALFAHPTVLTAAGEVAVELEVAPEDLQRLTGATVLALGQEVA